jgi:hypothetical protein
MLNRTALSLAAILMLTTAAQAGGYRREREYLPPAPQPVESQGTVNNYYGPTTVYQGAAPSYGYDYSSAYQAAPSYGSTYGNAYTGAYAGGYSSSYGSYGADYGAPWGQPFAGGVGYSPYGNYGGSYGAVPVYGARANPWNGYNGAPGNGYW